MIAFPEACPKCGAPLRPAVAARHFRDSHPGAIGLAVFEADPLFGREFVYIEPVSGVVETTWNVVWLDFPVQIVKLLVKDWLISWDRAPG